MYNLQFLLGSEALANKTKEWWESILALNIIIFYYNDWCDFLCFIHLSQLGAKLKFYYIEIGLMNCDIDFYRVTMTKENVVTII